MKKEQSNRLPEQQKEGQGPITIFHKDAQIHDKEVGNIIERLKNRWITQDFSLSKEELLSAI